MYTLLHMSFSLSLLEPADGVWREAVNIPVTVDKLQQDGGQ